MILRDILLLLQYNMKFTYDYLWRTLARVYDDAEAKSIVKLLLEKRFGLSQTDVYCGKVELLEEEKDVVLDEMMVRLMEYEPVQYVLENAEFCGHDFFVQQGVLIPRPETAELVGHIIKEVNGSLVLDDCVSILDIGTGSGCIAISLDKKLPDAEVEAWDISEEALAIARKNNDALEARVRFLQRDVLADDWEKIPSFDVIVSNPPYVTETEKNEMDANVLDWEPGLALFVPDEDPLRFYNRIARLGSELLLPGGKLYFEINQAYGRETAHILEMNQYRDVRVIKDIFGKDRIVTANR